MTSEDPTILFRYQDQDHEIRLRHDLAPVTIEKLAETLPARIDIHCAKIAGSHIFWHAPFLAEIEAATDIMTLPAGTFLYWPERQFLELIYGELQAETAAVTVLGRLTGEVDWLRELGRRVLARQGHEIVWAELRTRGFPAATSRPKPEPELASLTDARTRAWAGFPEEIERLVARRGIMLPYGPVAMAEGEFRKLHELLWRLRGTGTEPADQDRAGTAAFLIDAFTARIDGFCGLHQSGSILTAAAALLRRRPDLVDGTIQELILYTGRMAAWLDLVIPWHDLNEAMLAAGKRPSPRAGGTWVDSLRSR